MPGVAGIYVSGAFAGSLSTVSSGINSMSTCLLSDFIGSTIYPPLPEFTTALPTQVIGCKGDFPCNEETIGEPWCPEPIGNERSIYIKNKISGKFVAWKNRK